MAAFDLVGPVALIAALVALVWFRLPRASFSAILSKAVTTKRGALLSAAGRLVLSPQHSVHLIRTADRVFLIGAHSGGLVVLASGPWSEWQDGSMTARPTGPEAEK